MDEGYMQQKKRFCTNCGVPVNEGQLFCQNCGNRLEELGQSWQQPVDTWQRPQVEQPIGTWQQPQVEEANQPIVEPVEAWQQPQVEEVNQPIVEPAEAWQQPQVEEAYQPIVEPVEAWQQPQVEQPAGTWQQPSQPWQQPGQPWQYDYGQTNQQQFYYGGQEPMPGQNIPNQGMVPPNGSNMNQTPPKVKMDPKKKKKRIILFSSLGAAFLALIAVGIFLLYYFSFTRIDASKIYKVTYEGVNGKGRADVGLDEESEKIADLIEDCIDDGDLQLAFLISSLDFDVEDNEDLSNGDKVKVTLDYDKEEFDDYKIKFSNTTFEITVEDLKEATELDLFKDLTVNFEGVDGYGTASINNSSVDSFAYMYVQYSLKEDSSNLKNGDTVTVVADVSESILNDNGYTTSVFEKEYTVEGLKEVKLYDVFRDIQLVYEGVSPNLTVSVDSSGCEDDIRNNVYFYINDYYNKKNGDTVTVTAEFNVDNMRQLGYDIIQETKDYVIENQGEYISEVKPETVSSLDEVMVKLLTNWMTVNGDDYIYETDITSTYGDGYILSDAQNEIINRYFSVMPGYDPYNIYAVINKCTYTVTNYDKNDTQTKEFYIIVTLTNVASTIDGTYTYTTPETYLYSDDFNDLIEDLNKTGYSFSEVTANQ